MKSSPKGYALIVVLAAVVLCALMVIVLLERGTVGVTSASSYSHGLRVRALSDMAQNLVQAQIHDATTLNQKSGTALDKRDTWASQPGAIRVYQPDGSLREIFKLYSAADLKTGDPDLEKDVDPMWYEKPSEFTDLNEPVSDGSATHYPIVNPLAAIDNPGATGIANGFSITNAPVASGTDADPAPMPVRWIYVLRDGTPCQLGDSRIDRQSNPIVGRIAFWTDDETAKVNINTAAPVTADSYWDVPRASSNPEYQTFAWKQPAQNEYQRYPGHPAMVSLRSILGDLGGLSAEEYYALTPRYYWGGSEDGAKRIHTDPRSSLLTLKEDRSYVTVDELLFRSHPEDGSTKRVQPTPRQVDSLQFFLSASSRAPELNLFGQPRITIWPIHAQDSDTRRTPYDRLIAFCSTIGGKQYYFKREDPLSPTHDYADLPRNPELYAYLQRLTGAPVPGFPGTETFKLKYGNDRDQILTEIFDYIRATNLNETYQGRDADFVSYTPDAEVMPDTAFYSAASPTKGAGFVVPIRIGDTRGGGRFPAITGVGLWFVRHYPKGAVNPANPPQEQLSAMLSIKSCTPMHGYPPWIGSNLDFEIADATVGVELDDDDPNTPPTTTANLFPGGTTPEIVWPTVADYKTGSSPGGFEGAEWAAGMTNHLVGNNAALASNDVPIDPGKTRFNITAGTVDIRMRVNGTVVQSYRVRFPEVKGLILPTRDDREQATGFQSARPWWQARSNIGPFGPFPVDVLRSVELSHGDARLALMATTTPEDPFEDFEPHPDYPDATKRFAHSMRGYWSAPYLWAGGSGGSYVSGTGISYGTASSLGTLDNGRGLFWDYRPEITPSITNLRDQWSGDFDNGLSLFSDGPYLNKPDEGMMPYNTGSTYSPYAYATWRVADGLFSPLRQVPSAAMFGSLPTGVKARIPWRTLLFCPNPADPGHVGFDDPADHLLVDLFRMPVVEPYAISGPASTDGKINMNYAIAPFSYIRRASSWYALLEPLKLFAIPDASSAVYKSAKTGATNYRLGINIPETLKQFEDRFADNDIFRSATEIFSLFLVPANSTLSGVPAFWSSHRLTGDNSREKPYAELYPKLTTQSNTYQIHMRVQILPPSAVLPAGKKDFEPLAEYRGSRLIERYLNPDNPAFSSVDPDESNLNELYQYRVLETRQFNP